MALSRDTKTVALQETLVPPAVFPFIGGVVIGVAVVFASSSRFALNHVDRTKRSSINHLFGLPLFIEQADKLQA